MRSRPLHLVAHGWGGVGGADCLQLEATELGAPAPGDRGGRYCYILIAPSGHAGRKLRSREENKAREELDTHSQHQADMSVLGVSEGNNWKPMVKRINIFSSVSGPFVCSPWGCV